MFDLIVIGNGIAAKCFLWELSQRKKKISVLQIYDDTLAASCTLNSTATISLRGVQKGISPLGDMLFDSYQLAESFIKSQKPDGVVVSKFYSLCEDNEKEDYLRRFGSLEEIDFNLKQKMVGKIWDGYIIDPEKFQGFFDKLIPKEITKVAAMVISTEITDSGISITTLDGKTYKAKRLLLCTGAYSKIYEALYPPHMAIKSSSIVPGAYLQKRGVDLGPNSFVISKGGENLIYHSVEKILKIGSTTQKNGLEAPDYITLKNIWESFQGIYKYKLPDFSQFELKVGLRQKGLKRMPFYGKIAENVYGLMSLYKNGYTFPFLGAKEILNLMEK